MCIRDRVIEGRRLFGLFLALHLFDCDICTPVSYTHLNPQEALFLIDDATYLHIQPCDSGWDYTLYDAASVSYTHLDVYKRQIQVFLKI